MPFKPDDQGTEPQDTTGPKPGPLDMKLMADQPGDVPPTDIITPDMRANLLARGVLLPEDPTRYPASEHLGNRDMGKVKGMLTAISQKVGYKVTADHIFDANPANGKWILKDGTSHKRHGVVG